MNFTDFIDGLQNLTNDKITQSDIARILKVGRANIHDRIKRNSSVTTDEVQTVQDYMGVELFIRADNPDIYVCDNSGERQNDVSVSNKIESVGQRFGQLQDQHDYLDKDMAKLLNISEDDYISIKCGDALPNIEILTLAKQKFKVSIDWLLFGG